MKIFIDCSLCQFKVKVSLNITWITTHTHTYTHVPVHIHVHTHHKYTDFKGSIILINILFYLLY